MEAMLLSATPDQSISPYKLNRNHRKNTHAFISRPWENFTPSSYILNVHGGGLIGPPPSLSSSLSSSFSVINQQPPPLLPLPISKSYSSLPTRNSKGLSTSPTNRKTNSKTKVPDITPKKPKSSTSLRKPDSTGHDSRSETKLDALVTVSGNRLGPEPSDLPKKVSRVLKSKVSFASSVSTEAAADDTASNGRIVLEELSCSIFSLAPPPSSLPLPKFSLKPKLGCTVQAGGIDAGATDNLRRLLRLR